MNGPAVELPMARQTWTALETLAEVSRQIGTSEHPDSNQPATSPDPPRPDQLEVREQYTLDNPPLSYEQHVQRGKKGKFFRRTFFCDTNICRCYSEVQSRRQRRPYTTDKLLPYVQ